jgi:hypothetical protein
MSQLLQKPYDCMTCGQQIKIAKIDNPGPDAKKKWEKYDMDGKTPHVCRRKNQQRQQQSSNNDVSKEIAAIRAQLLVLIGRLDRLEQELQK